MRKEAPKPAFRSSLAGLKPFIVNRLHCGYRTSPGWIDLYHIASTRLMLHMAQSGENSQKNPTSSGLGISDFIQMKAEKRSHSVSFRPLIASAAARQTAS